MEELTIKERILYPAIIETINAEIDYLMSIPVVQKIDIKKLDVTNARKCFVGQSFNEYNKGYILHEGIRMAKDYREKVGKLHIHSDRRGSGETLLEIWGEDHFHKYTKLCKDIASFINGDLKERPNIIIDKSVSTF